MRNRLLKTVLATATVAAVALPAGAQARQGSDDPAGHVRNAAHQTATTHQSRERHRHRHGRGTDDLLRAARGGADDGPNHR